MKKRRYFIAGLAAALALTAACAAGPGPAAPAAPEETMPREEGAAAVCRIVDGAEEGSLLLAGAGEDRGLYRQGVGEIPVTVDGKPASAADLRDGMLVEIRFDGTVMESYPAQFAQVTAIAASAEGADDRCGLYLQVLEDLWTVDGGLNSGITELGVDLSGLTDLTDAEKAGVVWRFGERHGIVPLTGTWDELAEQGYIDRENLIWEEGCHFSVAGSADGGFDAQKWRSGLGAYFFCDCTAAKKDGTWTYERGSEAIS